MKKLVYIFLIALTTSGLLSSCRDDTQGQGSNANVQTDNKNYGETEGAKNAQAADSEGASGAGREETNQ
jgi:hypothetical protein